MNVLEKLRELHGDIADSSRASRAPGAWALAERLIARFPVDADEAARVFRNQDAIGLDGLIRSLESPGESQDQAFEDVSQDDRAAALRAFKKRLKLKRLDDESKLGGRYTSGGKQSSVQAIEPPSEFPAIVWKALVHDGRLKDAGSGFYALTE